MPDRQRCKKILVIEDERSIIMMLTHILNNDYKVLAAINGQTGFDVACKNRPDLIMLDVIMPDMSGFDVLVKLKNCDVTRSIPVVIITGFDNVENEERSFFLGAVDYITKPFHSSIVKARIKTHLRVAEYAHIIERVCFMDALTNIPSRYGFDSFMNKEWARAMREKKPISLLLIGIDNFRAYNDAYGYPQGDALLCAVSEIIRQPLKRSADYAARWGGDKLAVLLPNTDLDGALEVAGQIRSKIEQHVVHCPNGTITSVTVSIGVSTHTPEFGDKLDNFIDSADKALYSAKRAGKNNVRS